MFRSRSPAFESFEHLHHCKCHHLHSDGISAGCLPSVDLVFMRVRRFEFRGTSTSTCSDYFYFAVSLYVSSDLLCVRHIVPISRKPSPLGGYYLLHVALLRQMNRPLSRVVGPKLFNRTSTGFLEPFILISPPSLGTLMMRQDLEKVKILVSVSSSCMFSVEITAF